MSTPTNIAKTKKSDLIDLLVSKGEGSESELKKVNVQELRERAYNVLKVDKEAARISRPERKNRTDFGIYPEAT